MDIKINSPVLMPFGWDIDVLQILTYSDVEIYVSPMYKFWGKILEDVLKGKPTHDTLNYISEKIDDDFSGIVTKSKYYGLFSNLFNDHTAETIDKLYQIDFDKYSKRILGWILHKELEYYMDDRDGLKNPTLDLSNLPYHSADYIFPHIKLKEVEIKFLKEDLKEQKFSTIYDSISRKDRMYTPQYLGFISLFSGEKETPQKWNERLKIVLKNNLIHGGKLFLYSFPYEYEDKINKICRKQGFEKLKTNVWRKPDLKIKKISRGIKKWTHI